MAAELSLSKLSFRLLMDKEQSVQENRTCKRKPHNRCCLMSYALQMRHNCEDSTEVRLPARPLSLETMSCRAGAELVSGRNLLRPLLNRPLAADGRQRCFGVELQSFFQGLPDLLCVCQRTHKQHHEIIPSRTRAAAAGNSWSQPQS